MSPLLILGMHRSGTSCLTGCLEESGLFLGDVNTEAGFNKKGNRENRSVMDVHEAALNARGYAWDKPPQTVIGWSEAERDKIKTLIDPYPKDKPWGIKDPRTLIFLSEWKTLTRPRFIGTYRHPMSVADSLMSRATAWGTPMRLDTALSLWKIYNAHMLSAYAETPFDILRFDCPSDLYIQKFKTSARTLGLSPPDTLTFFEKSLRHHDSDQDIPKDLQLIWTALEAISV